MIVLSELEQNKCMHLTFFVFIKKEKLIVRCTYYYIYLCVIQTLYLYIYISIYLYVFTFLFIFLLPYIITSSTIFNHFRLRISSPRFLLKSGSYVLYTIGQELTLHSILLQSTITRYENYKVRL